MPATTVAADSATKVNWYWAALAGGLRESPAGVAVAFAAGSGKRALPIVLRIGESAICARPRMAI